MLVSKFTNISISFHAFFILGEEDFLVGAFVFSHSQLSFKLMFIIILQETHIPIIVTNLELFLVAGGNI